MAPSMPLGSRRARASGSSSTGCVSEVMGHAAARGWGLGLSEQGWHRAWGLGVRAFFSRAGEFTYGGEDGLHLLTLTNLCIYAHERLGAGESDQGPGAVFEHEAQAV